MDKMIEKCSRFWPLKTLKVVLLFAIECLGECLGEKQFEMICNNSNNKDCDIVTMII